MLSIKKILGAVSGSDEATNGKISPSIKVLRLVLIFLVAMELTGILEAEIPNCIAM